MNKNSKRRQAQARRDGNHFHGTRCLTCFADRERNPANKRKSKYEAPTRKYSQE